MFHACQLIIVALCVGLLTTSQSMISVSSSDVCAGSRPAIFNLPVVGTFFSTTALTYAALHRWNSSEKNLAAAEAARQAGKANYVQLNMIKHHQDDPQGFERCIHIVNGVSAVGTGLVVALPLVGYNCYRRWKS